MICPDFRYHDYTKDFNMSIPSTDGEFYIFRTHLGNFIEKSYIDIQVEPSIKFNIDEDRGFNDDKKDLNSIKAFFRSDNIITSIRVSVMTGVGEIHDGLKYMKWIFLSREQFMYTVKDKLIAFFTTLETEYDIKFSKFYKIHVATLFSKTMANIYSSIVEKEGKEICEDV